MCDTAQGGQSRASTRAPGTASCGVLGTGQALAQRGHSRLAGKAQSRTPGRPAAHRLATPAQEGLQGQREGSVCTHILALKADLSLSQACSS